MKLTKLDSVFLFSGLAIRLGLAPFTGHPGDMALFVTSQRLYYQTGTVDLNYFPTLPAVYYVQLLFYAPYQILRLAGMPDFQYFYHTTFMVEGLFLKLPMILCDVGIFLVLLRYTRKSVPAGLFFLNPFPICLSAVWGTYDSLMLLPLVFGLCLFATQATRTRSSLTFVISGLLKLFGFVAFALVICESIIRHRFRDELPFELLGGIAIVAAMLSPVFLLGGFQTFVHVLDRFIGLSSGTGSTHLSLVGQVFKIDPSGIFPTVPVVVVLTCLGYSYQSARSVQSSPLLLVKWTLAAALAVNLFSFAEPQWLSWLIPIGILYGSFTQRVGLQYFTYIFGIVVTFLTMTLLQGTGYMLIGTGATFLLGYVENVPGSVLLYAAMTTTMIAMFCGYFVSRRLKSFRLEVVPLTVVLYVQFYFWISIVNVGRILGVS